MASYFGYLDASFNIGRDQNQIKKFYEYVESFMDAIEPYWKACEEESHVNGATWLMDFNKCGKEKTLKRIKKDGVQRFTEDETVAPETLEVFGYFVEGLSKRLPDVQFHATVCVGSYGAGWELSETFTSQPDGTYTNTWDVDWDVMDDDMDDADLVDAIFDGCIGRGVPSEYSKSIRNVRNLIS